MGEDGEPCHRFGKPVKIGPRSPPRSFEDAAKAQAVDQAPCRRRAERCERVLHIAQHLGLADSSKVEAGSLYPALHRLEKRGWLKSEWGISEANHKAKYYQLTAAGKAQLLREQNRWSQLVDVIGRIMNPAASED